MAFKKNKKRFDPRYFMDEKTEELKTIEEGRSKLPVPPCAPKRLPAPAYDPAEQAQWEERRRKEKAEGERNINNNVGRYGQIPEGIENITPENIEIVVNAALQIGHNFAGPVLIGALGMTLQNAIEYLKGKEAPSAPPQEDQGINETNYPTVFLDNLKSSLRNDPSYKPEDLDKKIGAMGELMTPQVISALQIIADNADAVGDIHMKIGALALIDNRQNMSDGPTAAELNLFRILKVLGKYRKEWEPKKKNVP
mgnify:CR=1 FL=1